MDPIFWGVVITALGGLLGATYSARQAKKALVITDERAAQIETLRFLRAEVTEMRIEIAALRVDNKLLRTELAKANATLAKLERQYPNLF